MQHSQITLHSHIWSCISQLRTSLINPPAVSFLNVLTTVPDRMLVSSLTNGEYTAVALDYSQKMTMNHSQLRVGGNIQRRGFS